MPNYFPPPSTSSGGDGSGDMLKADNLSGLASTSTSRTNLGLGTASTKASGDFAQVANNLSDVTAATARTNLGLDTASTKASGDFAQVANNLSDITASTARTNLGLGTAAVQNVGAFAQVSNNLSDVTASTARTNLGLTSLATASLSGGPGMTTAVAANVATISSINPFNSGDGKPYNLAVSNQFYTVVTSGNYALSLTGGTTGQVFRIKLIQDATGSRTVSWWSGISWPAATAPTLTTTANKADWFSFVQTGASTYDGFTAGQNYT